MGVVTMVETVEAAEEAAEEAADRMTLDCLIVWIDWPLLLHEFVVVSLFGMFIFVVNGVEGENAADWFDWTMIIIAATRKGPQGTLLLGCDDRSDVDVANILMFYYLNPQ
mmetsp:Transcript_21169/g.44673  ORF Transcript_21169/g.44673 Transcript_21169/m.44673 type:complete len:110 (-) Transcript_21169:283-612(-)